ncbi:MAG: potassium transporter [Micrococcaceae bacterium]|jgi:hypothetical protein|nr:potassium transporter [Micrococcaceae bacterium]
MAETVLPGLVYLVIYSLTQDLQPSIMGAVGISVLFVVARLVQKTPLTQALAGIFGVVISAVLSAVTGKAENFYVWGFVTNAGYIVALLASVLLRWPLLGLAFGYVRNEGLHWRHQPARLRAYAVATWIMIAVLGLRLVVQFPLFLAGQVEALGATRLIMGLPLYALGLWLAWLVSRPAATPSAATASAAGPAATPRAAEPGASPDAGTTAP